MRDGSSPSPPVGGGMYDFKKQFLALSVKLPGKTALTKPAIDLSHFLIFTYHPGISSKELHDIHSPNTFNVIDEGQDGGENLKERYCLEDLHKRIILK